MEAEKFTLKKDKVHKIVSGGCVIIRGKEYPYCFVDGTPKFVKTETRGKKSKFWIISKKENAYLLKYETKNGSLLDNAGQFIMEGILEKLRVPHAEYFIVDFEKYENGEKHKYDAIMTKNYKKANEVEISGYILNKKINDREYDNNMGQTYEHHHTVKHYMEYFKKLYSKNDIDFAELRRELTKYCLIQYVFAMSDLHYFNLSFLYDENIGHKSMRVTPFYDCGNICCLGLSVRKVKNICDQFNTTRKSKIYIESLVCNKMPMFGLETDISVIYRENENSCQICRPLCEAAVGNQEKEKIAKQTLHILRSELANELLNDKKLMDFYENIKNLDIDNICEKYNKIKDGVIPEECVILTKKISKHNIDNLDEYIRKSEKGMVKETKADVPEREYDISELEIYKYLAENKEKENEKW